MDKKAAHLFASDVADLEENLKGYLGVKAATCLSSHALATQFALIALGVKHGDEIICPSFMHSLCVKSILFVGAKPVFVDSEPFSWNMSPVLLKLAIEERLKKGKKPKAIVVFHVYGMPARIVDLISVAKEFNIPVIEDATEALGSKYQGQFCGTYGDIGILCFRDDNMFASLGGGAIVSNNEMYCIKAKNLRNHFDELQTRQFSFNMSNGAAKYLSGQLETIDESIQRSRTVFGFYKNAMDNLDGIKLHEEPDERHFSNYWSIAVLIDPEFSGGITSKDLRKLLNQIGIESQLVYQPLHRKQEYSNFPFFTLCFSDDYYASGLCLPSGSNITDNELQNAAEVFRRLL